MQATENDSETLYYGLVIAAYGRHYLVKPDQKSGHREGAAIQCFPRGKKADAVVGDRISYQVISENQGVIVGTLPRQSLFSRSDQFKTKFFAANINQIMITVATEPKFSDDLLSRILLAAENEQITAIILLNKIDVESQIIEARERLQLYQALGYSVIEISALNAKALTQQKLNTMCNGRSTLLLGQSGAGKSTIVNLLIPDAQIATQQISYALGTGRHTTTLTRLFEFLDQAKLIDSPGFQAFGLNHLSESALCHAFREFRPFLGKCRFHNCRHLKEPECAILTAITEKKISLRRYDLYQRLLIERTASNF